MGVAPGGLIKQCILEDCYSVDSWDRDRTILFNVQILNSERFRYFTGLEPPKTPISAQTYAEQCLPYYKIWDEKSSVEGDFGALESVQTVNKTKGKGKGKGKGGNNSSSEHHVTSVNQPVILLKPDGSHLSFRPVAELNQEIARKNAVRF